jgi:subtilisin-like proprotein convertase family protein
MNRKLSFGRRIGAATLVATLGVGLTSGGVAEAKKSHRDVTFSATKSVNAPIPDAVFTPPSTILYGTVQSSITVGKSFSKRRIRDVNVLLQTAGTSGQDPARDLSVRLTAPNGATTWLVGAAASPLSGPSIGPLTFDDESPFNLGGPPPAPAPQPPAPDPLTLSSPYRGTAQPNCFSSQGACALSAMDTGPVSGTWTLTVQDRGPTSSPPAQTSSLVAWGMTVRAGLKFKTAR